MSRLSSIEIEFLAKEGISIFDVVKSLLEVGWSLNIGGSIAYLPIDHRDLFNWQRIDIDAVDRVMDILSEKEARRERVGIQMTWKDTSIGFDVLFDRLEHVTLVLHGDRAELEAFWKPADVSWYLSRILPALSKVSKELTHVVWEEHV